MSRDLSALAEFAEEEPVTPSKVDWREEHPLRPNFRGRVLTFDQSIADTGWAVMECSEKDILVTFTGNVRTDPKSKGHADTLERAVHIAREVGVLVSNFKPDLVVHETPPAGGRMSRPEASLVAATAVRVMAAEYGASVLMVGAQRAKKRLTGNGNAEKKKVKQALTYYFPMLPSKKPMNQAIYDAIAIGVVAAEGG